MRTVTISQTVLPLLEEPHGEPGHGLTGTTPYNTHHRSAEEKIGYVYLSEVSHNYGSSSYCYVCELNDDNNSDNSKKDE